MADEVMELSCDHCGRTKSIDSHGSMIGEACHHCGIGYWRVRPAAFPPRPARDGETLSDEQTVTGGDPIMGALSMFGSYIRCGDSWDSCAQQAYDRAESAVTALRAEVVSKTDALKAIADGADDPTLVAQMALFAAGLLAGRPK